MPVLNKIRFCYLYVIILCFPAYLQAQQDNKISCVAFVKKNSVLLRWVPASVPVWQTGIRYGYVIKRFTIAKEGVLVPDGLNKGDLLTKTPIRPASTEMFDTLKLSHPHAGIVQEAIYSSDFQQGPGDDFMTFMKTYEELEVRLGFALFICDLSPVISKAAGLQFIDTNIIDGERYAYTIGLSNIPDGIQIEPAVTVVDAGSPTLLPEISDVQAIFLDLAVKFRWPVMLHKGIYSAYILEKSSDGKMYMPVSDLPLVNFSEEYQTDYFIYTDSLRVNNEQIWYRVKGISPFGEIGPPSEVITGKGVPEFSAYASIDTAFNENGRVIVRWRVTESKTSPVKEINILRSETYNGSFIIINRRALGSGIRSFSHNNPGQSNYYQVMLTGNNNLKSYSFPYFVNTEDNDPPHPPEMLSGNVDSSGKVTIIWKKNNEPDLLGYKGFRANSPSEEFIALDHIVQENLCYDSINLNTLTQKIYYQIIAIDRNYNSSEYSATLELSRPDTISPAPAVITSIDTEEGKINIHMEGSPAHDITYYELFRQAEDDSLSIRVSSWEKDLPALYLDAPPGAGKNICYTLHTYDSSGNRSENGSTVYIPAPSNLPLILKARQSDDGKTITLSWELPQNFKALKTIIYRSAETDPIALYKTMEGSDKFFLDNDTEFNTAYNYRVIVYQSNGNAVLRSKPLVFMPITNMNKH